MYSSVDNVDPGGQGPRGAAGVDSVDIVDSVDSVDTVDTVDMSRGHLDGPLPLRVFPAQPGDAEHGQPDGDLDTAARSPAALGSY